MRSTLGVAASALAGLAASVAATADPTIVPFFIGLAVLGGVEAAVAYPPFRGGRRLVARGAALLWLVAAAWVGVLLLMYTVWEHVGPPPTPEPTFMGLPATVYHVIGLYGGVVLVLASAFGPGRWFERRESVQRS
jgi:hypothetical protein